MQSVLTFRATLQGAECFCVKLCCGTSFQSRWHHPEAAQSTRV